MWLFTVVTVLVALLWQFEFIRFGYRADPQPQREFFYVGGEYRNLTVGAIHISSTHTDCAARDCDRAVHDQSDLC